MKLDKLDYQIDAVASVIRAVANSEIAMGDDSRVNPTRQHPKNIDIKMETGTGKTYVYTRLMHELKQQYGFFKFIILVPSIAIKEGTKMSIQSADWNSHFRQEFANQHINLGIIKAGDFDGKKGKRKEIPEALRTFCEGTRSEEKTLQVLLLNDAMLGSRSMSATDYDSNVFGSISCPLEGLRQTRPIVLIDEPHRFNKENKAWKTITEGLQPQMIIRFGATFPDITVGKGKLRVTKKDYENLAYNLNAVRAFNEGLVKGVEIQYPAVPGSADTIEKFRVKSIDKSSKTVYFSHNKTIHNIGLGESLAKMHDGFGGITLEQITSGTSATLSNEMELREGLDLMPSVFDTGYQELLLSQALDAHFAQEKQHFYRIGVANNPPKIKTNTLFFIDSVASFRGANGEKGWLREKFEMLLVKKLESAIRTETGEYKDFLTASLQNISKTIAGYFSEDNAKKGDEAIQEEVDNILRNKEQMLRFRNDDGSWNLCRFLFSKWALREGWDNPNVFVIAKLRSSGSENSKIQEVGRGLRLPFDETGRRQTQQTNEDFRLTYIIDFSERDFARKLVGDINADSVILEKGKITDHILDLIVSKITQYTTNTLIADNIINENGKITDNERFADLLPDVISLDDSHIVNLLIAHNYGTNRKEVRRRMDNDDVFDDDDNIIKEKFVGIVGECLTLTDETLLTLIPKQFAEDRANAKAKLLTKKIIDTQDNIIDNNRFFALIPDSSKDTLRSGAVTGAGLPQKPKVILNKSNFERLRPLWNEVTKRYVLHFERIETYKLENALAEVLLTPVFAKPSIEIINERLDTNDTSAQMVREGYQSMDSDLGILPYGEFVKRLSKQTNLPINTIHSCMIEALKTKTDTQKLFNTQTLNHIITAFDSKFIEMYAQKFTYQTLDYRATTSIFTENNGIMTFVDSLPQSIVGTHIAHDIKRKESNYLYDKYVYDSEIEHQVLKVNPPTNVIVYGKLPRKSIKLPTYTGGTTTPDFVYAIQQADKTIALHLIVETKSENMRLSDDIAIKAQEKAFEQMENIHWEVCTNVNQFEQVLRELTADKI